MKKVKLTCRDNCKTARRNKIGGSLTEQSVLANDAPLHESTIVNDKLSTNPIKQSVSSELPLNNKKNQITSQYSMTKATIHLISITQCKVVKNFIPNHLQLKYEEISQQYKIHCLSL